MSINVQYVVMFNIRVVDRLAAWLCFVLAVAQHIFCVIIILPVDFRVVLISGASKIEQIEDQSCLIFNLSQQNNGVSSNLQKKELCKSKLNSTFYHNY